MSDLLDRIRQRPPAYRPTQDEADAIRAYFDANPGETVAWLSCNGVIADGWQRGLTSRTAQLASIQTIGIPIPVSRRHLEFVRA